METTHLKTVDPISQKLLLSASKRGIELSWERFEKVQPQDGFLRLGLSCPFGCMEGPCRIDPFGRGPGKGICGLGKDEMVAGMLLRLCLQGTLEALGSVLSFDAIPDVQFSAELSKIITPVLSKNGHYDLSANDIFRSSAMLYRPSCSFKRLLSQSFRLSLLTLGFLEKNAEQLLSEPVKLSTGYGSVADHSVYIGICGNPSTSFLEAIELECKQNSGLPASLVSLGEWLVMNKMYIPVACTSGEAELLLGSGAIHLLVAGQGTDPGLVDVCRQMGVPVITEEELPEPADVVLQAQNYFATLSQSMLPDDIPAVHEDQVVMSSEQFNKVAGKGNREKLALVGGTDTPQQSLGQLPVEIASSLSDQGFQVASWGDAALWMIKDSKMNQKKEGAPLILEPGQGPLLTIKALAVAEQLDRLQGICFTGLKSCKDFTAALGLAYLGGRVCVATPAPLHGSQDVCRVLAEMVEHNHGQFIHFDHSPQPQEILEWLTSF
ncbi:MAG: hypothetical protein KJO32_08310 [Deltaproteobacteria bacterium]|nr:hypothetical protein [Deltaproteobacteria bacterium]